jgi:hypothetical protein
MNQNAANVTLIIFAYVWLPLCVIGPCVVSNTIAGAVTLKARSRRSAFRVRFFGGWIVGTLLAYISGHLSNLLLVAFTVGLTDLNGFFDYRFGMESAERAFAFGAIPALAIATTTGLMNAGWRQRADGCFPYRYVLLIACAFSGILYFYLLAFNLWLRYIALQFIQARMELWFPLRVICGTINELVGYWYLLTPSIFLPCLIIAAYRNKRRGRKDQSPPRAPDPKIRL